MKQETETTHEGLQKTPTFESPGGFSSQQSCKSVKNNILAPQPVSMTLNAFPLFPKLSLWHSRCLYLLDAWPWLLATAKGPFVSIFTSLYNFSENYKTNGIKPSAWKKHPACNNSSSQWQSHIATDFLWNTGC